MEVILKTSSLTLKRFLTTNYVYFRASKTFYMLKIIFTEYVKFTFNKRGPFLQMGSTVSRLESHYEDKNLLFTTKFSRVSGAHSINLGKRKGLFSLGATHRFFNLGPMSRKSIALTAGPLLQNNVLRTYVFNTILLQNKIYSPLIKTSGQ